MKEFNGTNGYKYTYVATLDSVAPTITLVKEASEIDLPDEMLG